MSRHLSLAELPCSGQHIAERSTLSKLHAASLPADGLDGTCNTKLAEKAAEKAGTLTRVSRHERMPFTSLQR